MSRGGGGLIKGESGTSRGGWWEVWYVHGWLVGTHFQQTGFVQGWWWAKLRVSLARPGVVGGHKLRVSLACPGVVGGH